MDARAKKYKRKLDSELRHVKLILTKERSQLPVKEWLELVDETKHSILSKPEEYFSFELPPQPVLVSVIEQVFLGFLEDQRLRAVQAARPFKIPRPNDTSRHI